MQLIKLIPIVVTMTATLASAHNDTFQIVIEKGTPTTAVRGTELDAAKRVLALLKGKIGGDAIQVLLADEINAAKTYWHQLLANSTGGWVPVEAQAMAVVDPSILNSQSFSLWMETAGSGYPNDLIAGHPEIYFEEEPSNVIQSWGGGPITQFAHVPVEKQAFMAELPGWNVTATVSQTLNDNTTFSYAVSAIKEEHDGFGLYFAVYLPDNSPEERVLGLRDYLTVECANWLKLAYQHANGES